MLINSKKKYLKEINILHILDFNHSVICSIDKIGCEQFIVILIKELKRKFDINSY